MTSSGVTRPKYARPEFERRWLVTTARLPPLDAVDAVTIRDCYLDEGRLRLRRMEPASGAVVFKLCKKYGDAAPGAESITNLYLSAAEYALLAALPGWVVTKVRHRLPEGSLDHYADDHHGTTEQLWVFEHESTQADAAAAFIPPGFVDREITADADFSGAALARRFGARLIANHEEV